MSLSLCDSGYTRVSGDVLFGGGGGGGGGGHNRAGATTVTE